MRGGKAIDKSTGKAMDGLVRRLVDGLGRNPELEMPTDAESLCVALCQEMSALRGRPLDLRFEELPREVSGLTGLMLALEDRDVVVIERRVDDRQKPIIAGHEFWHMYRGHGSYMRHVEHVTAAARMLFSADGADVDRPWGDMVLRSAARSHCDAREEGEAETFGVLLFRDLRRWLVDDPLAPRPARRDAVVTRLRTTLGPR